MGGGPGPWWTPPLVVAIIMLGLAAAVLALPVIWHVTATYVVPVYQQWFAYWGFP